MRAFAGFLHFAAWLCLAALSPALAAPRAAVAPAPTLAAAQVPLAHGLPRQGSVRYALARGADGYVVGQVLHTWEHDGHRYRTQSVTETTGLAALLKPARVVQSSQGDVTAAGLRPHEFRHERVKGLDTASFDWTRQVVRYAGQEDRIVTGAQDMLSMYYQLVLLAPQSGVLEMPIATGRKLETYRFEVFGEERVTLPSGQWRALHLKTRGSGGDSIEVWLHTGKGAASRGLPLKIRFTDRKGEIFDQLADETATRETQ